ncbi:MAG: DUF2490 domain-containing protein [Paludibacteraceae bacterium]|nr:DUF2490 domain-containing protein [Paludibacteraceae bacterium]
MKRLLGIIFVVLIVLPTWATPKLKEDSTSTTHFAELRVKAEFTKEFRHGVSLTIGERISSRLYETDKSAYFRHSYTTLSLGYVPIQYLKLDAGYTLRLMGDKGWSDPNEFLRHRAFLSVTGKYKTGNWRFSLRERVDMNCRTDSVNAHEKSAIALELRHRVHIGYYIPGKPVQVFGNVELINTLNSPVKYLNTYISNEQFGQYLCDARLQLGTEWRIDKRNSLTFSYRFDYNYDRDINITKKKGNIELTRAHSFGHVISIAYDLNW